MLSSTLGERGQPVKLLPCQFSNQARSGLPGLVSYGAKSVSEPSLQSVKLRRGGFLVSPDGNGPTILLRLKLNFVSEGSLPAEGGMGPVKLFPSQYISSSIGLLAKT